MSKTALITGIAGQDGRYLAELLLSRPDEFDAVYGMIHTQKAEVVEALQAEIPELKFVDGSLADEGSLHAVIRKLKPDRVYNLGALSHVGKSFERPVDYMNINAGGPARLLEAIAAEHPSARFYQASTSEMFGKVQRTPQDENTPFAPQSPYGIAKVFAHYYTVMMRRRGLFACSGILFNHESPRRGLEFLTRKVTRAIARIALGLDTEVRLGNLHSQRDWGFAGDYVRAMYLMLEQADPDDYVVATGETHSGIEFVENAFEAAGMPIGWDIEPPKGPEDDRDEELRRIGVTKRAGAVVVRIDRSLFRPAEVDLLLGDSSKAKRVLGWKPTVSFPQLVEMMVKADLDSLS